ncbi:hypothetical protein SAMN05216317_10468 [Nitrosomonas eutropha]|nr:hypothetical protein SAMN05216317_10468 [Nitrosomonas eutropha]
MQTDPCIGHCSQLHPISSTVGEVAVTRTKLSEEGGDSLDYARQLRGGIDNRSGLQGAAQGFCTIHHFLQSCPGFRPVARFQAAIRVDPE